MLVAAWFIFYRCLVPTLRDKFRDVELDFVNRGEIERELWRRCIVTVNGVAVEQVIFLSTKQNMVKTVKVAPFASVVYSSYAKNHSKPDDFAGREVEFPVDGVVTETLRGKVQVLDKSTGVLLYGEAA